MTTDHSEQFHIPVLSKQVMQVLSPQPGEIFVDGTLGGGGHALQIAKAIQPKGKIIGIDLDPAALQQAKQKFADERLDASAVFIRGNYKDIARILDDKNIKQCDGILVDLGISSYDLDSSGRGFTFQGTQPLDMRFDPESQSGSKHKEPFTAKYILNHYSQEQLEKIFSEYGEEKFSRRIAGQIVKSRQTGNIALTADLLEIIKQALPGPVKFRFQDSARRIFQALRIEVNHELENLQQFLPAAFSKLKSGGRLAVISFHSLEDRMVKQYFHEKGRGCICPPDFPVCKCGRNPEAAILTKKPMTADTDELQLNPRSKPAKLRAIRKA